jgi:hypothetical protein
VFCFGFWLLREGLAKWPRLALELVILLSHPGIAEVFQHTNFRQNDVTELSTETFIPTRLEVAFSVKYVKVNMKKSNNEDLLNTKNSHSYPAVKFPSC